MSALTDAIRVLNDESAVFSFLPAINFLYYFTGLETPTDFEIFLTLSSLFLSALLFNAVTEISILEDGQDEDTETDLLSSLAMLVIGGLWTIVFLDSIAKLYTLFNTETIWPHLLSAVSIIFIFLLITDIMLYFLVPAYAE